MTDKKSEEFNDAELDQVTGGALLLPAVQSAREVVSSTPKKSSRSTKDTTRAGTATAIDALRVIN